MPPHENTSSPLHPQFPAPSPDIPPLHRVTMKASSAFARMLHIEAMSGIVLLIAAAIALLLMPWWIKLLKVEGIGQQVRADGPKRHLVK